jgi:SAM-dependent methyltransferase
MGVALVAAALIGVLLSLWGNSWWRKAVIAAGFPVSFALSLPMLGLGDMPAWLWLLPLVLMLLVYPVNTWADAPLFPTPAKALRVLPQHAPLLAGARVLDAGCGLGHGLLALREAYPQAQFYGLEWSATLRWLCAVRLPWARIDRGDIWLADWSGFDMVYLFQRPESMPRAVAKAFTELRPGAWMVSLDFEATQLRAAASYQARNGKMVWIYRAPFVYARP